MQHCNRQGAKGFYIIQISHANDQQNCFLKCVSGSNNILMFFCFCHIGKSLKEMDQPLSVLGVKNGCKIMMIGKKVQIYLSMFRGMFSKTLPAI